MHDLYSYISQIDLLPRPVHASLTVSLVGNRTHTELKSISERYTPDLVFFEKVEEAGFFLGDCLWMNLHTRCFNSCTSSSASANSSSCVLHLLSGAGLLKAKDEHTKYTIFSQPG